LTPEEFEELKEAFGKSTYCVDQSWVPAFKTSTTPEEATKRVPEELQDKWKEVLATDSFDEFDTNRNLIVDPIISAEIRRRIDKYLRKNPDTKQVFYRAPFPLSIEQVIIISNELTYAHSKPVVVWPESSKVHEEGKFKINYYCRFPVKVTVEHEAHVARLEIFKTYKEKDADRYHISFMSEKNYRAGVLMPELAFNFDRYVYQVLVGSRKLLLLSGKKLHIGAEYIVKGLVFDIPRLFDTRLYIGAKQTCVVADEITELVPDKVTAPLLAKCKGKDREWFMRSVMYPYHNCLEDYSLYVTLGFFHLQTGFPFNQLVVGEANSGKSRVLAKFHSITGEPVLEAGAGTVRGLMPTFSANNADCGFLASQRYKAMVNEFFSYITGNSAIDRQDFMSKAKGILEGNEVLYQSGNGKQTVQMTADLLAVGNPPHSMGAGRFGSVMEMYEYFDPALMDRILFYWQPIEQNKIVAAHKHEAVALEAGVKENGILHLERLDYGELLTCEELKALLVWCRNTKFSVEDSDFLDDESTSLAANIPVGIFTRNMEFMVNAASSFAVMRCLSDGLVLPETKSVVLTKDDLRNGRLFIQHMVNQYVNEEGDELNLRFKAMKSLTPVQSKVFGILSAAWENGGEEKYARMVQLERLRTAVTSDKELMESLEHMRHRHLCVYSHSHAMLFPDVSMEVIGAYDSVVHGFQPDDKQLGFKCVKLGLLEFSDESQRFSTPWSVLSEYAEGAEPRLAARIESLKQFLAIGAKQERSYEECYIRGYTDSVINHAKRDGSVLEPVKGKLILAKSSDSELI